MLRVSGLKRRMKRLNQTFLSPRLIKNNKKKKRKTEIRKKSKMRKNGKFRTGKRRSRKTN